MFLTEIFFSTSPPILLPGLACDNVFLETCALSTQKDISAWHLDECSQVGGRMDGLRLDECNQANLQCVVIFRCMPFSCWHLVCRKDQGPELRFEQKASFPFHPEASALSLLLRFTTGPSIISLLRGRWGTPQSLTKEI